MSMRTESQLRRNAWLLWAFLAAIGAAGIALEVSGPASTQTSWGSATWVADVAFSLIVLSFPTVGLLILHRQPGNRFGWLLLLVVGGLTLGPDLLDSYATYGLVVAPGSLPGADVAAGLNEGSWALGIGAILVFVVLYFPDGRLPSPRWRWLPWVTAVDLPLVVLGIDLGSRHLQEAPVAHLANPLAVDWLATPALVLLIVSLPLLPLLVVAAAVAMVMRFRRSQGVERAQLKWLASAAAVIAFVYFLAMLGGLTGPDISSSHQAGWVLLLENLALASFALLPAAIATAILRHRLYDIDVVIKRTVVYASLTATLAAVYLLVVLTLRSLTGTVTGDSDLAVAASTLVVAGLFRPLRRRIQQTVDRRFYRRAYDAGRTVDAFSARLRQEVDLEAVTTDLRHVVSQTMQPTEVSLWLRSSEPR